MGCKEMGADGGWEKAVSRNEKPGYSNELLKREAGKMYRRRLHDRVRCCVILSAAR